MVGRRVRCSTLVITTAALLVLTSRHVQVRRLGELVLVRRAAIINSIALMLLLMLVHRKGGLSRFLIEDTLLLHSQLLQLLCLL